MLTPLHYFKLQKIEGGLSSALDTTVLCHIFPESLFPDVIYVAF